MRVGDEHGLEGAIALRQHFMCARHQRFGVHCLVDRPHIAEAEMRVDAHFVADLAAEQPPHWNAKQFAQDVPQGHLDAGDGAHADHAEAPETVLLQHAHGLFDVARVAAQQQRRKILDGADDRPGLPLQRRLAPSHEVGTVGLDADEDPVAHLGVHDTRRYAGDLQRVSSSAGAVGPCSAAQTCRPDGAAVKKKYD